MPGSLSSIRRLHQQKEGLSLRRGTWVVETGRTAHALHQAVVGEATTLDRDQAIGGTSREVLPPDDVFRVRKTLELP